MLQPDPVTGHRCDVLLAGSYFCDLVFTGLPEVPRLGHEVFCRRLDIVPGAAFTPALALQRLGLDVRWSCEFGDDLFSRFALDAARAAGLNSELFRIYDRPLPAVTVAFSFANERAFLTYRERDPESDLPALVREYRPKWALLMSLKYGPALAEIVQAAHEVGTRVYMDCQAHHASLDDPEIAAAIAAVDVFAPNREEALQLTGAESVEAALAALARYCPLVIIKLGAQGAIALSGDETVVVPGIEIVPVETTGAGDNFNCGYVYADLKGYALRDRLRCGNICGGLSTTAHGGSAASPVAEQVETMLSALRMSRSEGSIA